MKIPGSHDLCINPSLLKCIMLYTVLTVGGAFGGALRGWRGGDRVMLCLRGHSHTCVTSVLPCLKSVLT